MAGWLGKGNRTARGRRRGSVRRKRLQLAATWQTAVKMTFSRFWLAELNARGPQKLGAAANRREGRRRLSAAAAEQGSRARLFMKKGEQRYECAPMCKGETK